MIEINKIRSVNVDGIKTSLFTKDDYFHMIEHDEKNNKSFYKNIAITTILPVLITGVFLAIDYALLMYVLNTSWSVFYLLVQCAYGGFLSIQIVAAGIILFNNFIGDYLKIIISLFTANGRFRLFGEWGSSNSFSKYINTHFRNKEISRYSRINHELAKNDSIVAWCSKVDDETLINFIKDCRTSENLSNKIQEVSASIIDPKVNRFIAEELRELKETLDEELAQVDNRCKEFIYDADRLDRLSKQEKSNANALKLLAS